MKLIKPLLAEDWYEGKVQFPCWGQPKIDGVRGGVQHAILLARSLKVHENKFTFNTFSKECLNGFDGEFISGTDPTADDLCRLTSSEIRRKDGLPNINYWVFDYVTEETKGLTYRERYDILLARVAALPDDLIKRIAVVPNRQLNNLEELLAFEDEMLLAGYEGIILRNPNAVHKSGKSTGKGMECWRIKRFIEEEFLIESISEGQHNTNEAKKNELGRTERSTDASGMQPNGLVGALHGPTLKDILDPTTKALLIPKGTVITVSPGFLSHEERKYYFENQKEILGEYGKFSMFPKGVKDKPRFPQLVSFRSPRDMG